MSWFYRLNTALSLQALLLVFIDRSLPKQPKWFDAIANRDFDLSVVANEYDVIEIPTRASVCRDTSGRNQSCSCRSRCTFVARTGAYASISGSPQVLVVRCSTANPGTRDQTAGKKSVLPIPKQVSVLHTIPADTATGRQKRRSAFPPQDRTPSRLDLGA